MNSFAVIFVALVALHAAGAAPLLAPLWDIIGIKPVIDAQILDPNKEYTCTSDLCIRLLSSGTPTDESDGLVIDLLNPDNPFIFKIGNQVS